MKNQPSNSTSWSDNALRLLVIVAVFQVSKMPFQSMNSTPKLLGLTLNNASSVSRFRHVLLLLLTQLCFEKPRLQTIVVVGITSMACHSDIRVGQLIFNSRSRPQKPKLHAYFGVDKLKITSPQIWATPHWLDQQEQSSTSNVSPTGSTIAKLKCLDPMHPWDSVLGWIAGNWNSQVLN